MRASNLFVVSTAEIQGMEFLIALNHVEAFNRLAEIRESQYVEEVDELVLQIWRMKTNKNPRWNTTTDYIEDWRMGVLITTTSGYHNLVLRWNTRTLLKGAKDQARQMESATYRLMDDEATDPSVMILVSERSSKV